MIEMTEHSDDGDSHIQKVMLANGAEIAIETRLLHSDVQVSARIPSFGEVASAITSITQELSSAIKAAQPQKASIEFGIELAVEAGGLTAVLVKGSGKANLKITLTWDL